MDSQTILEEDNADRAATVEAIDKRSSPHNIFLGWIYHLAKEVLETVLPALIIAFLVTHFLGERTVVYGQSMEPYLHPNQQLIIDKLSYRFHEPRRGDIVVIDVESSDIPYIKRVVGLPGEVLHVQNNRVYINGDVLSESYISEVMQDDFGPVTIPANHIFVMGDNRPYSRDSRTVGTIPLDNIIARAWFRVWPLTDFGPLQ